MKGPPPHVDIWSAQSLVIAPLGRVSPHRHAAAVMLVGVDAGFGIRCGARWYETTAAFVPAGLCHELDCASTLMAAIYFFPVWGGLRSLACTHRFDTARFCPQVGLGEETRGDLAAIHGGDYNRGDTQQWVGKTFASPTPLHIPDARIITAANVLQQGAGVGVTVKEVAAAVGYSETRLMHLFKSHTGVSMRRYRRWERIRLLATHVASGENLTRAGLAAGFANSSHLSHDFREMFGVAPSLVLNRRSTLRTNLVE